MHSTALAERGRALKGGIVGGIVGGVLVSLYMLFSQIAAGGGVWQVFKGAGAPFLGERAMRPGFDAYAVLVGIGSHFAVSIGWGILFGLLVFGLGRTATLLAGVALGLVAWIGMFYVLLPLLGLGAVAASVPVLAAIAEHVVFGLGVALGFLPFQVPLEQRARADLRPRRGRRLL